MENKKEKQVSRWSAVFSNIARHYGLANAARFTTASERCVQQEQKSGINLMLLWGQVSLNPVMQMNNNLAPVFQPR